jgi:outer membrane lipoprotein-sorting protein
LYRKNSLRCILSFLILPLSAAWAAAEKPVTVEELQKALTKYQAIERLDVDFKQTKTLKDIQLDLKSEGHLTLKMPAAVEWKILKPQPMTVILADQKITIQSASSTQTFSQAENPSAKDRQSFQTMLTWLKLDAAAISDKYNVTETGPREYRFVAKDPKEPVVKSLAMKMDPSGHVANLLFEEVSGDSIQLNFSMPKVTYKK